ncbi:MAG: fatty acid desaturase family protein [Bacteroidia bacterium]
MSSPKFVSSQESFHSELRKRINQYFEKTGKRATGNFSIKLKAAILMLGFAFVYTHLVFFTPVAWLAILECIVLGGLTAAVGFNIMHDGGHGSFSRYKWVNKMAGLSLNFLGANIFMWNTKHNIVHHTYTNIEGVDDDLNARPFLRLCSSQKRFKMHRYQHLYFGFVYGLLYLYWVFFTDYKKYFTQKVGSMPIQKMKPWDHISFWSFKLFYIFVFVLVPIYTVGFGAWLTGFLIFGVFAGLVLSIVFQLAHTVEETQFPVATVTNTIEDEWAIHQLKTTANFATRNKVISWLVGGLNFQIEHHLFPKISHVHYPAISKIIKKACEDYGFPYIEYPKMREAVASHVAHLYQLGRK